MSRKVLHMLSAISLSLLCILHAVAQEKKTVPQEGFGVCKPVTQRTAEIGCWILGEEALGPMKSEVVYWHLDAYPSEKDATAEKVQGSTVLKSLGRYWLLTIGPSGWKPAKRGERVAEIGPIAVDKGKAYSALYMEAVMTPGMSSSVHTHSGPEIWYTEAGKTCLETPQGKIEGTPGHPAIVPAGATMLLTATGKTRRRAIVLILHDSKQPPTAMIHDWKPRGLCQADVNK